MMMFWSTTENVICNEAKISMHVNAYAMTLLLRQGTDTVFCSFAGYDNGVVRSSRLRCQGLLAGAPV